MMPATRRISSLGVATSMLLLVLLQSCTVTLGFLPLTAFTTTTASKHVSSLSSSALLAKKKKGKSKPAKGFNKAPAKEEKKKANPAPVAASPSQPQKEQQPQQQVMASQGLTSVQGGSKSKPTVDPSLPVEDRTAQILRESYGMRTLAEQQEEKRRDDEVKAQRKKIDQWKQQADKGEDFDIMAIIPAPLLVFIDRFLKIGLAICTVLFVSAGGLITAEAWSKASDSPLPDDLDNFIVTIIEPNFTYGLLVLLGFSVSLGIFAAAQLSSARSTYREDR